MKTSFHNNQFIFRVSTKPFFILLCTLLCLVPQIRTGILSQNDSPQKCSPEDEHMFNHTYLQHITSMGLTVDISEVEAAKCQRILTKNSSSHEILLLIKNLKLQGENSSVCPLMVMYDTQKGFATIKLSEVMIPGFDVTCNFFLKNESEEAKNSRVRKVITRLVFESIANSPALSSEEEFSLFVSDFFELDRIFKSKVVEIVYWDFTEQFPFYMQYLSEDITRIFVQYYEGFFNEYVVQLKDRLDVAFYNNKIKLSLDTKPKSEAKRLFDEQLENLRNLNFYNFDEDSLESFGAINLACCAVKVKHVNQFMKKFHRVNKISRVIPAQFYNYNQILFANIN